MKKKEEIKLIPKHYHFEEGVYDVNVELFVNMSFEEADKVLKKRYPRYIAPEFNPNHQACTFVIQNENRHHLGYAIILLEFDWYVSNMATLTHEIWHLVNKILGHRGVLEEVDNDEAYAYYIGYWTERFFNVLKPERKNGRR